MTDDPRQDWQSLLELLEPIHDAARASARRMAASCPDGDDLFQEAVVRALRKLPGLRDRGRFGAWFYAVMLSVHRSRARRAFWKRLIGLETVMDSGLEPVAPGRSADEETMRAGRLTAALAKLPAVQREAIVLHDLDGYPMDDVAAMQGVTTSAVKTRVSRGRARLREHYRRLGVVGPASRAADAADTVPGEVMNG